MQLAIGVTLKASAWAEANRDAIWRAIVELAARADGSFSGGEVLTALRAHRSHALAGFLESARVSGELQAAARQGRYVVAAKARIGAEPISARRMQQMWNILRGPQARRGIAPAELSLLSSTAEVPISMAQAVRYLDALAEASFLRVQEDTYRLPPDRNTGPLAPRLLRAEFVVDPNGLAVSAAPIVASEVPL